VFIANPNNPTGTLLAAEELHGFLKAVPENVAVVLDEAYVEFLDPAARAPSVGWLAEFPNLIVTRTFSKAWGLAALRVGIYSMYEAGYATEHDKLIAEKIAYVLCGGDLSEPGWVPEQHILDLEQEAFVDLCREPKTIERIAHMLQFNKPLRN